VPADTFWFSCQGFGVRVVNSAMSETTPDTEPRRGIYAASISAKKLWWYWEPEHALEAYDTTDITADRIVGRRAHKRPLYTLNGQVSFDRKTLAYTSDGDAAYPDGTHQTARGSGTCVKIEPEPAQAMKSSRDPLPGSDTHTGHE
jgi:hypothetical protein